MRSAMQVKATDAGTEPILAYPSAPPTPTMGPPPAEASALSSAASSRSPATILGSWEVVDIPAQLPGEGGRWEETQGQLAQNGVNPAASLSAAETMLLSPEPYGDVTIRTAFYDARNGTVGLVARASDRGAYRVRLHTDPTYAGEALVVEKVTDGVAVPLLRNAGAPRYQRRSWHQLALTVRGGQITVTLDGALLAQVEDAAPLPAGRVGLYTRALGGIVFAQVTVAA